MGLFSGLLKLGVDTVTLPFNVVKAVVEPEALSENVEDIIDDIGDVFE